MRVSVIAFQQLLAEQLNSPDLGGRLRSLGSLLAYSLSLRNDSNYESLVLAHQYQHRNSSVNIKENFDSATLRLTEASEFVLAQVALLIDRAFDDNCNWLGEGSPFRGIELRNLLYSFVWDKIRAAEGHWSTNEISVSWDIGLPLVQIHLKEAIDSDLRNVARLKQHIRFTAFSVKAGIMGDFMRKVIELSDVLRHAKESAQHPSPVDGEKK